MKQLQMRKGMTETEINIFVDSCLKEVTLKERVGCMSGGNFLPAIMVDVFILHHPYRVPYPNRPVKHFGIPAMAFSDGPRGVDTGHSTCFPVAMARGASFDRELEERISEAIGKELRAQGGNCFGGVCVNLLRHPAWGRAQETYSGDPYHVGEMGASLTRGVGSGTPDRMLG
jgi:beta-glucosidase